MRAPAAQVSLLATAVALLSSFVKNIGALAIVLPVALQIARRSGTPSSVLLDGRPSTSSPPAISLRHRLAAEYSDRSDELVGVLRQPLLVVRQRRISLLALSRFAALPQGARHAHRLGELGGFRAVCSGVFRVSFLIGDHADLFLAIL